MIPITRVVCIYAPQGQSWAVELTLAGATPTKKRLTLRGPEHVETFLDAYDDCDQAHLDPATGEVRFVFDGEADESSQDDEEEAEREDEEDEAVSSDDADDSCEVEDRPGENDGGFAGEINKDAP